MIIIIINIKPVINAVYVVRLDMFQQTVGPKLHVVNVENWVT